MSDNPAHDTAVDIRDRLSRSGWAETRVGHFRHDLHPGVAVEVGYVYGEVTVRMKKVVKSIDRGQIGVLRGVGPDFYKETGLFIDQFLRQEIREREDAQ